MMKSIEHIGFSKNYWLVTILAGGLCFAVQAQTPSFSQGALPPLPSIPLPGAPVQPSAVKLNDSPAPVAPVVPTQSPALPELAAQAVAPTPVIENGSTTAPVATPDSSAANMAPPADATGAVTPNTLADLPPPIPEGGLVLGTMPTPALPGGGTPVEPSTAELPPGPILPDVALPVPPSTNTVATLPGLFITSKSPLPEEAVPAAPQRKTWQTTLAPTTKPMESNFNYRRVVQPDAIYRKQYDRDNQHLPVAVTREDYVALLFQRAAANDVTATRALLNAGISANTRDGAGQTVLSIARQYGASDTAALLVARGANS